MIKKAKINWADIKVKLVPACKDRPNQLNPYSVLSAKKREQAIVSICGKIWARHVKNKLLQDNDKIIV